jgi:hypothetical protein
VTPGKGISLGRVCPAEISGQLGARNPRSWGAYQDSQTLCLHPLQINPAQPPVNVILVVIEALGKGLCMVTFQRGLSFYLLQKRTAERKKEPKSAQTSVRLESKALGTG